MLALAVVSHRHAVVAPKQPQHRLLLGTLAQLTRRAGTARGTAGLRGQGSPRALDSLWQAIMLVIRLSHLSSTAVTVSRRLDPVTECTELVCAVHGRSVHEIFGSPDDLKFHSSMTLFALARPDEAVFTKAVQQYFGGKCDLRTKEALVS